MSSPFIQKMKDLTDSELSFIIKSSGIYSTEEKNGAKAELLQRAIQYNIPEENGMGEILKSEIFGQRSTEPNVRSFFTNKPNNLEQYINSNLKKIKLYFILYLIPPFLFLVLSELFDSSGIFAYSEVFENWTLFTFLEKGIVLFQILFFPLGFYFFLKEKQTGYLILLIIIFSKAFEVLINGAMQIYFSVSGVITSMIGTIDKNPSLLSIFNTYSYSFSFQYYLLHMLHIVPLLVFLSARTVKERYGINKKSIYLAALCVFLIIAALQVSYRIYLAIIFG